MNHTTVGKDAEIALLKDLLLQTVAQRDKALADLQDREEKLARTEALLKKVRRIDTVVSTALIRIFRKVTSARKKHSVQAHHCELRSTLDSACDLADLALKQARSIELELQQSGQCHAPIDTRAETVSEPSVTRESLGDDLWRIFSDKAQADEAIQEAREISAKAEDEAAEYMARLDASLEGALKAISARNKRFTPLEWYAKIMRKDGVTK